MQCTALAQHLSGCPLAATEAGDAAEYAWKAYGFQKEHSEHWCERLLSLVSSDQLRLKHGAAVLTAADALMR